MATNRRAYAFILREKDGIGEMLVFRERGKEPSKPFHIPGGGLEPGEIPEEAIVREIEEESGLTGLKPSKFIGQWVEQQENQIFQRYFFLFHTSKLLPDTWTHKVTGNGLDSGIYYDYQWVSAEDALRLHVVYHSYLKPKYLPMLFPKKIHLGLQRNQIYLLPFSERWAPVFEAERDLIRIMTDPLLADIQHIGSTSVFGMVAKPIIDIGIAFKHLTTLPNIVARLERVGYQYLGPHGVEGRQYLVKRDVEEKSFFHIHMYPEGHSLLQRHLVFRNALRTNDELAEEYYLYKLKTWSRIGGDRENYTISKGSFFDQFFELNKTLKVPLTESQ